MQKYEEKSKLQKTISSKTEQDRKLRPLDTDKKVRIISRFSLVLFCIPPNRLR